MMEEARKEVVASERAQVPGEGGVISWWGPDSRAPGWWTVSKITGAASSKAQVIKPPFHSTTPAPGSSHCFTHKSHNWLMDFSFVAPTETEK